MMTTISIVHHETDLSQGGAHHFWLKFHGYHCDDYIPHQLMRLANVSDCALPLRLSALQEIEYLFEHPVTYRRQLRLIKHELLYRTMTQPQSRSHQTTVDALGSLHCPDYTLNLNHFKRAIDFPTDPGDGIEWVKLTQLGLKLDNETTEFQIKHPWHDPQHLYDLIREYFGEKHAFNNPNTLITHATLSACFQPNHHLPQGKQVHLELHTNQPIDIPEHDFESRMIRDKYLARWSLIDLGPDHDFVL